MSEPLIPPPTAADLKIDLTEGLRLCSDLAVEDKRFAVFAGNIAGVIRRAHALFACQQALLTERVARNAAESALAALQAKHTELANAHVALAAERAALQASIASMRHDFQRIVDWNEFPPSGQFCQRTGAQLSYGTAFGSNGERDYMREIARQALVPIEEEPRGEVS